MATTLLVASAGGHRSELARLTDWFADIRDCNLEPVWVTYSGSPQLEGFGGRLVEAYHPTTKNLPNAMRNYRLARRVFASYEISRVVSTGAAVAVPFMIRAQQLGIPCHYIESATRVDGPSLSGRILQHLKGVHLYRQTGDWGGARWRQGPCVFDPYTARATEEVRGKQVVVSLGMHSFAFDAAVAQLRDVLMEVRAEVLWQLGSTPDPGNLPGKVVSNLPTEELQTAVKKANIVVGHAGVGLSLMALDAGKVPVLLPRRRRRREHTDDHQVQLARELQRRDLAVSVEVEELAGEHLASVGALKAIYEPPAPFRLED